MERYLLLTFPGFWGDSHMQMDIAGLQFLQFCFSALRTVSLSLFPSANTGADTKM